MKPEEQTRQEKIDLQLGRAGWAVGSRRVLEEYLVKTTTSVLNEPPGAYRTVNEFADYALMDRLGRVLAIVEAKRSSRNALEGERQASDYAAPSHPGKKRGQPFRITQPQLREVDATIGDFVQKASNF